MLGPRQTQGHPERASLSPSHATRGPRPLSMREGTNPHSPYSNRARTLCENVARTLSTWSQRTVRQPISGSERL